MSDPKTVTCEGCSKPLVIRDDSHDGDMAWFIENLWWCDECARLEFRKEVSE